ncbi:hypothetical protein JKP88DRAFT_262962 [Tribonema minus]|uniref:Uncharacterized protein n=1 Tax=Tribonema minus TaxID=303371 RepID=A0A835Z150_9STRA|nr:hypothetical protein JKP88DRAFT_262962 [Tribonema minus]
MSQDDVPTASSTLLGLLVTMVLILALASDMNPAPVVKAVSETVASVVTATDETGQASGTDVPQLVGRYIFGSGLFGMAPVEEQVQLEQLTEEVLRVGENVVSAAVPTSVPDAAALAVAEGLAGVLSSTAVYTATVLPALMRRWMMRRGGTGGSCYVLLRRMSTTVGRMTVHCANADAAELLIILPRAGQGCRPMRLKDMREAMEASEDFTEAVARADYIYASSAARAIMQGLDMNTRGAAMAAVMLAQLPYQFIKQRAKRRAAMGDMAAALAGGSTTGRRPKATKPADAVAAPAKAKAKGAGVTARSNTGPLASVEWIQVTTDLITWLGYDVLTSDFMPAMGMPLVGPTAAACGFIATLSSQVYRDLAQALMVAGGVKGAEALQRRTSGLASGFASEGGADVDVQQPPQWLQRYWGPCLSSAAFFGLFEVVHRPFDDIATDIIRTALGS